MADGNEMETSTEDYEYDGSMLRIFNRKEIVIGPFEVSTNLDKEWILHFDSYSSTASYNIELVELTQDVPYIGTKRFFIKVKASFNGTCKLSANTTDKTYQAEFYISRN